MSNFSEKDIKLWKWATEGTQKIGGKTESQKMIIPTRETLLSEMTNFLAEEDVFSDTASAHFYLKQSSKKLNFPLYNAKEFKCTSSSKYNTNNFQNKIDLHGLTQQQAYEELKKILKKAYQQQWQHVLIITGKGVFEQNAYGHKEYQGILFKNVPRWLNCHPLKKWIQNIEKSTPEKGGEGALYITIKRN